MPGRWKPLANRGATLARAKALGMATIGMTGAGGGKDGQLVRRPPGGASRSTPAIQQVPICLCHYLCAEVEARFETAVRSYLRCGRSECYVRMAGGISIEIIQDLR